MEMLAEMCQVMVTSLDYSCLGNQSTFNFCKWVYVFDVFFSIADSKIKKSEAYWHLDALPWFPLGFSKWKSWNLP